MRTAHDYWYDQGGLRVKKTEDATGTPVTTYTMFEGNNPLMQEVYEGSTRKAVWFHIIVGEQILARMGKTYPSTTYTQYFYLDNLGSRRVVFDETGTVTNRFRYSAWGVAAQDVGADDVASFTGKDYDATGLIYFNARYYDPITGRFLTEDPARKGGNWYAYCDNNPVNATDPTGLDGVVEAYKYQQRSGSSSGKTGAGGGGDTYVGIYRTQGLNALSGSTAAMPGRAMSPNTPPMDTRSISPSPMETWKQKPSGATLTKDEAAVQSVVGSTLMVAGAVGAVLGAEVTAGTSVLAGAFVMADGGYMIGQANGGLKANPGEMFLMLTTPTPVQIGNQQYQFMSPLP